MSNFLNRIVKTGLYLLIFLTPVFWLPFTFEAFEFNKQYLLFSLVSVVFFSWLAKQVLFDKEIRFRRTPLDFPVIVFLFISVLSSIFTIDKHSSIFGFYGRFSDGLISLLSYGILYFLITNNVGAGQLAKSVKPAPGTKTVARELSVTVNGAIKAFLWSVSLIVLVAYFSIFDIWQKLQSSLGAKIHLPQIVLQKMFNPAAGSLEGLSIFLAAVLLFLTGYAITATKGKLKWIGIAVLFLAVLILLVIVDYLPVWIMLLVSLSIFVGFSLWKRVFKENVNKLLLPIALVFVAIFFLFINMAALAQNLNGGRQTILNSLPREQVLDQGQSWLVGSKAAINSFKNGFLGSGIGTWHYDFSRFKSTDFNKTWLWQIRFDRSGNYISEILGTMGALGILSYFFLIIMFALVSWMMISQKPQSLTSGPQLPILLIVLALFVGQFVYYQNSVLAFGFWLMLALSIVSWQKPLKENIVSFKDFPELALVFSIILTIIGLSFVTMYFFAGRYYLADIHYRLAIEKGQIGELEKAVAINPGQPNYKIILSRAYFNEVMVEAQKPTEQRDQAVLSKDIYLAITYLKGGQVGNITVKGATELAPNRVTAWETLGMIYRDIQGAAAGASDWAIKSFTAAANLEPTNPVLHTELGKLYLAANDTENAKSEFQKAKSLKADYEDASIQMSALLEKENNLPDAIKEIEGVASIDPYNVDILFQLGRLYFNNKQTDQAIAEFQKIIALMPNHSNAHYSLGIAYQAKGDTADAVAEFQKVLELNPGNPDVQAKIDELKATTTAPKKK